MRRKKIRSVLIVDDDLSLLEACRRQLRRDGRGALTAANSATALQIAKDHEPDLVIVDLLLAGEDGIDLIRQLRARHRSIKIAMWTGYGEMSAGFDAARAGANAVLSKPTTPREVIAMLENAASETKLTKSVLTLTRAKIDYVQRVLADVNGNMSEAARRLGVPRYTLYRILRRKA